jgi:ribosome-associated protein
MQISRSEKKRRIKEVEKLVAELVSLPSSVLERSPFPDEIKPLVQETAKLQGSARQRSVKHITKLILEKPLDDLYSFIGKHRGKALEERKQLHTLEFYRDALINEAIEQQQVCRENNEEWGENWTSDTLTELKGQIHELDELTLSRLSYLFAQTRNPRYSREIFRYLRSLMELQQRNNALKAKV